ncbi:hypothetical protein DAI22_04g196100 [Oryza sativa Japonica Group]|nr:hypothetical protein DAI22_04g196100 [Oryza sativa Japonica Group]
MENKHQDTWDADVLRSGIIGWPSPMCVLFSGNPAYDHYSMKLASIDGFDGKMAAFNLTLLVGSRRWFVKNCFSHGQVTVSYAGVPMGEGRVRGGGFCAEPRSEEEAEAELRWGAAEFDVEARLFRNGGDTRGSVMLLCKVGLLHAPPRSSQCQAFTNFVFEV